ncbi:MAG: cation transporter [Hyphomicrobiaceae bacterium]
MPQERETPTKTATKALRNTVALVAFLNLAYFGVEFTVARLIGSVSLYADSIDFLEDASVNILVLLAIGWTAQYRRIIGLGLAALLLVPSAAALWTAWQKVQDPSVADPLRLTLTATGALLVNGFCAYLLARVKSHGGSLSKAAFLSARNDVLANAAMIGAGLATAATLSIWPDIAVGLGIAALNANAAWEVYEAALAEDDAEEIRNPQP